MKKPKDHEYCLRCGRKLKDKDARKIGYGKTCYKKMQTEKQIMIKLF